MNKYQEALNVIRNDVKEQHKGLKQVCDLQELITKYEILERAFEDLTIEYAQVKKEIMLIKADHKLGIEKSLLNYGEVCCKNE